MLHFGINLPNIIILFLVIVISMVLHELAHGYVALWNGDPTAKINGRLTLNPLAHFDIIGFFMMLTVGFGYAKPVPVNPYNFRHRRRGIFTVAIAGVSLNLLLAFFSSGLYALFSVFFDSATIMGYFRDFFAMMTLFNLNLFFFNLIPIHPLDGFRVIESFTRYNNRVVMFFRKYGQYILLALIGLGIIRDILGRCGISLPIWCDPLYAYVLYAGNGMWQLFGMFWGLFI